MSALLGGCFGDSSPSASTTDATTRNLLVADVIGSGMYVGSTYLAKGTESASNFWEHDAQSVLFAYGKWVFVTEPMTKDRIVRYTLDAANRLESPVVLQFDGGSTCSHITFASATKAYVSLGGSGVLAIIDPSTMKRTGTIDLTPWAVGDASPNPSQGVIRDGKLFVALSQRITTYSAHDTGYVAVIDVSADTVIKVVTDPRVTCLGSPDDGNATLVLDEKGDIYFYSNALWGYQAGAKGGFVRIRAGETEFDTSYYFNVPGTTASGVTGGAVTYGTGFAYAGNGIAYSMLQVPGLTSNPPDYAKDHNYQPVKVDLRNKTIEAVPLPASSGSSSAGIVVQSDGTVLFAEATVTYSGIFRYFPSTGKADSVPVLKIQGNPYRIMALGN
jgi:hypothetical protein